MRQLFISFETDPKPTDADLADEQDAGRPVFERLVASLQRGGSRMLKPIAEWNAYGWFVEVEVGEARLVCMLQRSDQWLVLVFSERRFLDRFRGGRRHYDTEMDSLADAVCVAIEDAFGIPAPKWQTEDEFRGK